MAIKQSNYSKSVASPPRPQTSGAVHVARFTYEVKADVAAADIVEIGILPGYAKIVDAALYTEGAAFGAVTADVGIMSGEVGSLDAGRTVGNEVFAAQSLANTNTTLARMTKVDPHLLAPVEKHRGVGLKFSALAAGVAGKKITLVLTYAQ